MGLLNVVCLLSGGAVEEEGGVVWGFLWGGEGGGGDSHTEYFYGEVVGSDHL